MLHSQAIQRLLTAKANLSGNSLEYQLSEFIAVHGSGYEPYVWDALIDTIEAQNKRILELQTIVQDLINKIERKLS